MASHSIKKKIGRGASRRMPRRSSRLQNMLPQIRRGLITALILVLVALMALNSRTVVEDISQRRIEYVVIEGSLNQVTEDDIRSAVFDFINQSMVAIDLDQIKQALESNPWVQSVTLRRKWPDTLIIGVSEEVAIARWGDAGLLNQNGDIFMPSSVEGQSNLAALSGPPGTEKRVMEQYQVFNQLLYPENLRIARLQLNRRNAWSMTLTNGADVKVGSIRPTEKVRRFASIYQDVFAGQSSAIGAFDLRYEDGIAIRPRTAVNSDVLVSMQ